MLDASWIIISEEIWTNNGIASSWNSDFGKFDQLRAALTQCRDLVPLLLRLFLMNPSPTIPHCSHETMSRWLDDVEKVRDFVDLNSARMATSASAGVEITELIQSIRHLSVDFSSMGGTKQSFIESLAGSEVNLKTTLDPLLSIGGKLRELEMQNFVPDIDLTGLDLSVLASGPCDRYDPRSVDGTIPAPPQGQASPSSSSPSTKYGLPGALKSFSKPAPLKRLQEVVLCRLSLDQDFFNSAFPLPHSDFLVREINSWTTVMSTLINVGVKRLHAIQQWKKDFSRLAVRPFFASAAMAVDAFRRCSKAPKIITSFNDIIRRAHSVLTEGNEFAKRHANDLPNFHRTVLFKALSMANTDQLGIENRELNLKCEMQSKRVEELEAQVALLTSKACLSNPPSSSEESPSPIPPKPIDEKKSESSVPHPPFVPNQAHVTMKEAEKDASKDSVSMPSMPLPKIPMDDYASYHITRSRINAHLEPTITEANFDLESTNSAQDRISLVVRHPVYLSLQAKLVDYKNRLEQMEAYAMATSGDFPSFRSYDSSSSVHDSNSISGLTAQQQHDLALHIDNKDVSSEVAYTWSSSSSSSVQGSEDAAAHLPPPQDIQGRLETENSCLRQQRSTLNDEISVLKQRVQNAERHMLESSIAHIGAVDEALRQKDVQTKADAAAERKHTEALHSEALRSLREAHFVHMEKEKREKMSALQEVEKLAVTVENLRIEIHRQAQVCAVPIHRDLFKDVQALRVRLAELEHALVNAQGLLDSRTNDFTNTVANWKRQSESQTQIISKLQRDLTICITALGNQQSAAMDVAFSKGPFHYP